MTDVFDPAQALGRDGPGQEPGHQARAAAASLLTGLGARYRLHRKDLPGSPDVAMPGRRLAIFVHGCFWHGHDCARGSRVPKANRDYWLAKVARNTARDARNRTELEAAGWRVETAWECQMKDQEGVAGEDCRPCWTRQRQAGPPPVGEAAGGRWGEF